MKNLQRISIVMTAVFTPITIFSVVYKDQLKADWNYDYMFFGLWTFYGFLLVFILWSYILKFYKWFKFWTGLDVIIGYQNGHLEIVDKTGKEAYYYEESEFRKLLFRRKENYKGIVTVDGFFNDFIHQYNCFANLSNNRKRVEIRYGFFNRHDRQNTLIHSNQKHFSYSLTLNDSFLKKEEYWEIHSKHYTRLYNVKISFPLDRPPKNARLIELFKNKQGEDVLKELSITPLIIRKYNRIMIKVKLLDLKESKKFRICWDW